MLLASLALGAAAALSSPVVRPDSNVFNGRENALKVAVPRVEQAEVRVDGALDEPVWGSAAVLTGFSQFQPVDGRPSADSTEVLVWYSATAIHFGIRAHEAHGAVNATLADRDRIFGDDHVQILLNTFNDGRQAFVFAVNPFGVQADGTLNEGTASRGGGFDAGGRVGREPADLSADFVFESKGRTTATGYEVELRVPFKSLRYQATDVQDWGIHVMRRVQHLGHEDSWVPATQAAASFLAQAGTLTGLRDLRRGLVLDLTPSVVWRQVGSPRDVGDRWSYQPQGPEVGATMRWGITNNLSLNATVRPDFSQVEADVGAFQFDPRDAIFFPERRPFFLEGIENFQTPNSLVYTRAIVQPDAAVKLTGKIAGTNVAVLSAVDDRGVSFTGDDNPFYNIVRLVRDIGGQSRIGAVYTDRIDGEHSNRVAGLDALVRFRRIYTARLQAVGSRTDDGDGAVNAPLWRAQVDRDGRRFSSSYSIQGIDPDFRADAGFINRVDAVRAAATHRLTFYGGEQAKVESYTLEVMTDGNWNYDRFVEGESVRDKKLHLNNSFALRGGWRLTASALIEKFGYDPSIYRGYMIERYSVEGEVVDTIPFTGTGRIPNLDWVLAVNTPDYSKWSANAFYLWGRDENFFEWASANIIFLDATVRFRPTDQLRLEARYQHQEYNRRTDGSTVAVRKIPRLKAEYQIARPLFFRLVGQYDAFHRDSLRDESRTGFPLLIPDGDGVLQRTSAVRRSNFRADWLFSYQPNPGTVIFAGYGSTLTEDDPLRFRSLRRTDDGFFVKVSYLFRM